MLVKTFLFHRVNPAEQDHLWCPMTPSLFEKVIRQLKKSCEVVLLEELLADPGAYRSSGKTPATLAFDDGYKDNIEYAAPILKKYNCPASFYVVTGGIDTDTPTWTYVVDRAIYDTHKASIELPFDFTPAGLRHIALNVGTRKQAVSPLKSWLKMLSNTQRLAAMKAILEQCDDVPHPAGQMMSWSDIRQLQQSGYTIGSHTHSHPMLGALESEQEIQDELSISAGRIKAETGKAPVTISYPINSFDERVIRIAKACGYKYGLAVGQKFFRYNEEQLLSIPRLELYQERWWKTRVRMSGLISRLKKYDK